jgi:RHS repeat-associated protein
VEVGSAQEGLGYTGEWQDPALGLHYLRARWLDVGTGRFTQKDVWQGEYIQPLSLNPYLYVLASPATLRDPSGFEACGSQCGPDITDWFAEELKIHRNWVQTERSAFDAETLRKFEECLKASPSSEACIGILTARQKDWLLSFADYAKAIPYKWMHFRHLVPDCPSVDCLFTVTLCDTCIHRGELGNIMFGFTARDWGWTALDGWLAREIAIGAGALQQPWDRAAAGIGYHLSVEYTDRALPDPEALCASMKGSRGDRAYHEASWENIQKESVRAAGCQPCEMCIVASTPHSTPACGSTATGISPLAGKPDYEYYTDQMPAGMLDPLLQRIPTWRPYFPGVTP